MGNLYGYLILAIFAFVFIGISVFVSKKFPVEGVDDFVAAGRGIPASLVAASVMVSWVWTTTIMGAAEAGMSFGVSGGLSYAWGNSIPFFVLIPLVLHLRNKMPKCTTFTEFVEQRYGRTVSKIFFVFGIGVIIYVLIAQGVGIGIVFNSMFGIPYEIGAAIPLAIATASSKSLLKAYIIGTVVAWMPIPILCGGVFGGSVISLGVGEGAGLSVASEAAPYIMKLVYGGGLGSVMFVLMVFMAGMTTGGGCLSGAQALFTADFYKKYVNKTATEEQQMNFGRKIVFAVSALVIVVAILLKGKSLLMMDIFSGILFAAPTSSLIAGMYCRKTSPTVAVISIFCGLASGLIAYFVIPDGDINWFVGNVLALLVPAVIVIIGSLFSKYEYDFNILKNYEPDHSVN